MVGPAGCMGGWPGGWMDACLFVIRIQNHICTLQKTLYQEHQLSGLSVLNQHFKRNAHNTRENRLVYSKCDTSKCNSLNQR